MDYLCGDDYLDEEDCNVMYSTQCNSSDSDEETLNTFSKWTKKVKNNDDSESEDEFEKDMSAELSITMQKLTKPLASTSKSQKSMKEADEQTEETPEFYDNIYFDSDDSGDDEGTSQQKPKNCMQRVLTNDELMYDPLLDDKDQSWVDSNRMRYHCKSKSRDLRKSAAKKTKNMPQKLPHSDAVLSCPACFTTLCLDCQRHQIYKTQYRAMFVFNCKVDVAQSLVCPLKSEKKNRFKKQTENRCSPPNLSEIPSDSNISNGNDSVEDTFHPVRCEMCNTKVAVFDKDEVYHFFNVLTSYT